jgi:hypothetical protein
MKYLIQTQRAISLDPEKFPALLQRASLNAVQTVLGLGVERIDSPKTEWRFGDWHFFGRLIKNSKNPFSLAKGRFGSIVAYHSNEPRGAEFREFVGPECSSILSKKDFCPNWLLYLELDEVSEERASSIAKFIETTTPGIRRIEYPRIRD